MPGMQAGDRDFLLENGYVVLRQVVPPHMLAGLQDAHDRLVDMQAKLTGKWPSLDIGRASIVAGSPNGVAEAIDEATAPCVEWWTHECFHGVSSRLLGVDDAAATTLMMLCSEEKPAEEQHSGTWYESSAGRPWHRTGSCRCRCRCRCRCSC